MLVWWFTVGQIQSKPRIGLDPPSNSMAVPEASANLIPAWIGVHTSLDVGLGFHSDDFFSEMKRCNPHTVIQAQFAGNPITPILHVRFWIRRRGLARQRPKAPPNAIRTACGLSVQIGAAGASVRIAARFRRVLPAFSIRYNALPRQGESVLLALPIGMMLA